MADQENAPLVGIIMGSKSDLPTMEGCTKELEELGVPYELVIASAHRNPDKVHEWAGTAHERGLKVIIAAAGKAAHLGGVVAAFTPLPVIERPRRARFPALHGADAFRCSGCVRRHQRCQERCHLRYADSRCHHARVPRCHFQDEAGDGRGVALRRRRGANLARQRFFYTASEYGYAPKAPPVLPAAALWMAMTHLVAAALPAAPVSDSGIMASAKAVSSTRLVSSGWMVMLWKRLAM